MYFDPQSPEDLAEEIEQVLSSRELRESLRAKGLERAARFTWKESIEKIVRVYQAVLGESAGGTLWEAAHLGLVVPMAHTGRLQEANLLSGQVLCDYAEDAFDAGRKHSEKRGHQPSVGVN